MFSREIQLSRHFVRELSSIGYIRFYFRNMPPLIVMKSRIYITVLDYLYI